MGFTQPECLEEHNVAFSVLLNDDNNNVDLENFSDAVLRCQDISSSLLEPKSFKDYSVILDAVQFIRASFPTINFNREIWLGISKEPGDRNIVDFKFISGDPDNSFFAFVDNTAGQFPWRNNEPLLGLNNNEVEENCVRSEPFFVGNIGFETTTCTSNEMVMCFRSCEGIQPSISPTRQPSLSPTIENNLEEVVSFTSAYSVLYFIIFISSILLVLFIIAQVVTLKRQIKQMKSVLILNKDKLQVAIKEDKFV